MQRIAAAKAVRAADSALKITAGPGWWRSSAVRPGGLEDEALKGLRALQEWIASDDRMLTGEYLRADASALPMETREWIDQQGREHQMVVLSAVEIIEGRTVTDFAGAFAGVLNEAFVAEVRRGMERRDLTGLL